jgi:two-component system response regulator AtoC
VQQLHERLDEKFSMDSIVGESPLIKDVIERVKKVAQSKATILIEGESGTGKELVAQAIHQSSPRARGPFIAVHCAALSESLLESELFGHERGSFTGATERRIGRFESADGGTLFLDEIGEISGAIQVKLLRFLETKAIDRVGGSKTIELDVRLVTATNKNLEQLVREGKFREDLYFRLDVVRFVMPPLRDRAGTSRPSWRTSSRPSPQENGVPPLEIEPGAHEDAAGLLLAREHPRAPQFLRERGRLRKGGKLTEFDLDPRFRGVPGPGPAQGSEAPSAGAAADLSVEQNEKRILREALIKSRGNRTKAAQLMGISRRTLHRKLAQWPELDVTDK